MPGSEFRLLPRLPLEYKTYKLISPGNLGKAMTQGWVPVASVNYETVVEKAQFSQTRFLIAKGMKKGAQAVPGAGPTPVLMFAQPGAGAEETPPPAPQVQQFLDRLAQMSQEEILELHTELQRQGSDNVGENSEDTEVREAMDELLGDDDGTEDDDE